VTCPASLFRFFVPLLLSFSFVVHFVITMTKLITYLIFAMERPDEDVSNLNKRFRSTFPNVLLDLSEYSQSIIALMTILRDKNTTGVDYVRTSDRLCTILAEEGIARCQLMLKKIVTTPTGEEYQGLAFPNFSQKCCTVSIMRSGDILSDAVRRLVPEIPVGKVLIQRQEHTVEKSCVFIWSKFPHDISERFVFICDPMLGTGGTIVACIRELVKKNVAPKNVLFLNVISCPEGLARLHSEFPDVKVVTCQVDPKLNEDMYITPGLGDYGDRYFQTT
jgi:uracil phosphoribosyltransferase